MKHLIFIFLTGILASCSSQQKIIYLQNQLLDQELEITQQGEIKLQQGDIISITVSSQNPELSSIFNLSKLSSVSSASERLDYTVDPEGEIYFPVLGKLKVVDMTKSELTNYIKTKILEKDLLKDPIVNVEFMNLSFYTLGEVNSPGKYLIDKERTTIFDALSTSGDLTINGIRERIFVTRRSGDKIITYQVDLRDRDIYKSPAFYIMQNDVIYVEPNKTRSNQSTANGNSFNTVSFWTSIASFLTTVTLLFINL